MVGNFWQNLRAKRTIPGKDHEQALLYRVAGQAALLLPQERSEANLRKQLPGHVSVTDLVWDDFSDEKRANRRSAILGLARIIQDQRSLQRLARLVQNFHPSNFENEVVRTIAHIVQQHKQSSLASAEYALAEQVALLLPGLEKRGERDDKSDLLLDHVDFKATLTMVDPYANYNGKNKYDEQKAISVINFLHPKGK